MKPISTFGKRRPEPKADDLEPVDSMGLVESIFLEGIPEATRRSIEASAPPMASMVKSAGGSKLGRTSSAKSKDYSTEKLLMSLYDVHDSLVSSFEGVKHTSALANRLSSNISKISECIVELGGEIETFTPLDHVSGLSVPSSVKNANQVIQTTKECYNGDIEHAAFDSKSQAIAITFMGHDKDVNMLYRAEGCISSKTAWDGNEAIDYIYTPGEGKMSVKVLEHGKWLDKSDDYRVGWELQELDLDAATQDDLLVFKKIKGNSETPLNNESVGNEKAETEEENLDFTIEEI